MSKKIVIVGGKETIGSQLVKCGIGVVSKCPHKWEETPEEDPELEVYTCSKCGKKDVC